MAAYGQHIGKVGGGRMVNPTQNGLVWNKDGTYSRVVDIEIGMQETSAQRAGGRASSSSRSDPRDSRDPRYPHGQGREQDRGQKAGGNWMFRRPGFDPKYEAGNWYDGPDGKPQRVIDLEPPDGYWEYELDEYEQLERDGESFRCPDLKNNKEDFRTWYMRLRWIHFLIGCIQLAIFITIVVFAANGELTGRVRSTTNFLYANPAAPPALASDQRTFNHPHLYWLFFVPLVCGLVHFVLGWPQHLVGEFFDFFKASHQKGDRNAYGELHGYENWLYQIWFYKNVVYELAGVKHLPYAICYALLISGIGFVVGVTDVFLVVALFMCAFASALGLWYMEYGNGKALKAYYMQKVMIDTHPGLAEYAKLVDETGEGEERSPVATQRPGLVETVSSMVSRPVIMWIPYVIAFVLETFNFIVLWFFFGTMIAHNSSHIHWYVWVSMIWYTSVKVFEFATILFYWLDFYIFRCYVWMETAHLIAHAATFGVITTCIVFGSMDDGILYA